MRRVDTGEQIAFRWRQTGSANMTQYMSELRQSAPWSYFLAACEHRNMTAAAATLGISQPALTQAVARLEQSLGVPLFDRSTRPMTVTAYGELVRDHALAIERSTTDLRERLEAMRGGTGGLLRFGCGPDWVNEILPDAISTLSKKRPALRFSMHVTLNDDLRAMLDAQRIDFFFASVGDEQFGQQYSTQVLLRDTMAVVVRSGHPLLQSTPLELASLSNADWVNTGPATYGHRALVRFFADSGAELPPARVETNSVRAMVNIVRRSDMLGFLSTTHASSYPDLEPVATTAPAPQRLVGVTWRKDRPLMPAARLLIEACGLSGVPV